MVGASQSVEKIDINACTVSLLLTGKIVYVTGPRCPEGSRKLRFPDYMEMAQDGGKVVSLTHRSSLSPRKCSWYSFLLEAESTPGS